MLDYNEIKERKYIVFNGDPFEVLSSHVFRKQQRKPVNQTKLRNLLTGKVVENSFHHTDKVEEANISKKKVTYLFHKFNRQTNSEEYWFCEEGNPSKRFELEESLLGEAIKFVKTNDVIDALLFDEKVIGVDIPVKVDLKVTEAAPAVAGNTAQGATKQVTLETGAEVSVPLFIKEGEVLAINTQTGEYTGRAN
tara:strand:+ start:242 stop:823 length:582 start_codon:yes stop_codon:yes gene_type:complete